MAEEEAGRAIQWRQRETAFPPRDSFSLKPQPSVSVSGLHFPHEQPSQRLSHIPGNQSHINAPGRIADDQNTGSQRRSIFRLAEPRGHTSSALLPTPDDTVGDLLVEMEGDLDVWKGFEKRLSTLKDERKSVTTQEQQIGFHQQAEQQTQDLEQPLGTASGKTHLRPTARFSNGSQRRRVPEKAIRIIQDQLRSTQESIEKVKAIFRRGEDGCATSDRNGVHMMQNGQDGTSLSEGYSHRSQGWPFLTQPGGADYAPPLIKNLPQETEGSSENAEPGTPGLSRARDSDPSVGERLPSIPMKRRKHEDVAPPSSAPDADCCRSAKRARYDMERENPLSQEDTAFVGKPTLWERMTRIKPSLSSRNISAIPVVGGRRFLSRKLLRPFSLTGLFEDVAAHVLDRFRGRNPTQCVAGPHSKDADSVDEVRVVEPGSQAAGIVTADIPTENSSGSSNSSGLVISEEGAVSDETTAPFSESFAEDDAPTVTLEATDSAAAAGIIITPGINVGEQLDDSRAPFGRGEERDDSVQEEKEETGCTESDALSPCESANSSADAVLEDEFPTGELTVESDGVDTVPSTTEEEVESVQGEEDDVQLASDVSLERPQSVPVSSSTASTVPSARLMVVIDDEEAAAVETASAPSARSC